MAAELYFDHNVPYDAAVYLRDAGYSVRTASNIGKATASDDEHVLIAALNRWFTVTTNGRDFILLHDAWHRWSRQWRVSPAHAGILIIRADWVANRIAGEIHAFLQQEVPIENRLYTWDVALGWRQRTEFP